MFGDDGLVLVFDPFELSQCLSHSCGFIGFGRLYTSMKPPRHAPESFRAGGCVSIRALWNSSIQNCAFFSFCVDGFFRPSSATALEPLVAARAPFAPHSHQGTRRGFQRKRGPTHVPYSIPPSACLERHFSPSSLPTSSPHLTLSPLLQLSAPKDGNLPRTYKGSNLIMCIRGSAIILFRIWTYHRADRRRS